MFWATRRRSDGVTVKEDKAMQVGDLVLFVPSAEDKARMPGDMKRYIDMQFRVVKRKSINTQEYFELKGMVSKKGKIPYAVTEDMLIQVVEINRGRR